MSSEIAQFILMLSEVHRDSLGLFHFARKDGGTSERSTMPVTAFVYGFFLYNSLYSIDWDRTLNQGYLINHPDDKSEGYKQQKFEEFIREFGEENPSAIREGFSNLICVPDQKSWTEVVPDRWIAKEEGEEFFLRMNQLVDLVTGSDEEVKANVGKIFARIQICRIFIYQVRNNIFHGTKTLGQIWDRNQLKRIATYSDFLQCIISCFFEISKSIPSFTFG